MENPKEITNAEMKEKLEKLAMAVLDPVETVPLKGLIMLVEGNQIVFRYCNMGVGEALDRVNDMRNSLMAKLKA